MLIIGISGQTGAGKSTLAQMLSKEGLGKNLEVDAIGHQLLTESHIKQRLVAMFGADILDKQGQVCRKSLGRKAFQSKVTIAKLNSIMHPAMVQRVKHEIALAKEQGQNFLIINAALLFSMKLDRLCQRLIYVVTSPEIRLERLIRYRNWSKESAKKRLFAQDELPKGRSDIIIINNDHSEVELANEARRVAILLKGTKHD